VQSLHGVLHSATLLGPSSIHDTVGRMQITLGEHGGPRKTRLLLVGLRRPATDFEQVCGAAQAALRISRVVSDVVRAYGIAGGRYG
jgi:hypothetical protein